MKRDLNQSKSILITGAGGYLGHLIVKALAEIQQNSFRIIATDLRVPDKSKQLDGVKYIALDIRAPEMAELMKQQQVDACIHLAALVTPGKTTSRELQYAVDVLGTKNILEACLQADVGQLVISSSGAAYGYYADFPQWIEEDYPLRGNHEFAYSDHKRQIEEMLADWRKKQPQLKQLIFRPSAILGATTANQITALFHRPVLLGLIGTEMPFTFIWDEDVVECIIIGVREKASGIFNLAADGKIGMQQIAGLLKKPYLPLPVWLVTSVLWLLKKIRMTQYGPEQVVFLRYRPCLSNTLLKEKFGFIPRKTSLEVIEYYIQKRNARDEA